MYQPELGRFLQPDPKEFPAGDYNLYRYCHNDPVNRSDPFGDIDPELLKNLKTAMTATEKAQRKDHTDRTQNVMKDGTFGKMTPGRIGSHYVGGSQLKRDTMRTEKTPEKSDSVAGSGHYHSAPYYRDAQGHDTSLPTNSGGDIQGVRDTGKPMLFGNDHLKASGQGILIEPQGRKEPSQTVIQVTYDK